MLSHSHGARRRTFGTTNQARNGSVYSNNLRGGCPWPRQAKPASRSGTKAPVLVNQNQIGSAVPWSQPNSTPKNDDRLAWLPRAVQARIGTAIAIVATTYTTQARQRASRHWAK